MQHQVRIYEAGQPSAMQYEAMTQAMPEPGPGQVHLRHEAIGLNFVDTLFRNGAFNVPLPFSMGVEAAGVVLKTGRGVQQFQPGERVAYFFAPGAYASERLIDASQLVRLPDDVSSDVAAAVLTKGLTAWMMLFGAHQIQAGETVLVHAAAGGVGSMVARWAQALGAKVFATVGTPSKASLVSAAGIEHVLDANDPQLADQVRALNGGRGVDVVYELVGLSTFAKSVAALRDGGHLVHIGNASGNPVIDRNALAARGLRYQHATTGQFAGDRTGLETGARTVFAALKDGVFGDIAPTVYQLADVVRAHEDLEARRITGPAILIP
jgi:NADPH2:quinone reductase